jgi:hypothetical protein
VNNVTMRVTRSSLPLILLALVGCDAGGSNGSAPAPVLVLTDTVQLAEPSSGPLGTLGDFVRLPNGGYLVSDPQTARVLEFDAQGNPVRSIGRKGSGPEEFRGVVSVAVDGDSVLYVLEPLLINVLDYRTGALRKKTKLPAPFSSIAARNANVYFRGMDAAQFPTMSIWRNDSVRVGPRLPASSELEAVKTAGAVENAKMMNTTHALAVLTPLQDDTVAVLSEASENIVIATSEGVVAQIPVARTQRQGVRADVIAKIATDPEIYQRDPQLLYTPSIPTAVSRDAAGNFHSVKTDLTFLKDHFSAKLFLSVADPRRQRTCPDALIPGPEDPKPAVALRGDTLFVLSQEIEGTAARTVIRKYLIETKDCRWVEAAAR